MAKCNPVLVKNALEEHYWHERQEYPKVLGCECDSWKCRFKAWVNRLLALFIR